MRVLTWNLFHGRAAPPAGRPLLAEFSAALDGWDWDVALLQEVPPWWPGPLSQATGADDVRATLTSRNSLPRLRRGLAERWPDLIKSNGGGCNAILVRGEEIAEHRVARLRRRPERRVVHGVRLVASDVWVVNVHAQVRPADAARADVAAAVDAAQRWAHDAPLVFGGDLNLRAPDPPAGMTLVGGHDVDHVLVRGLAARGVAQTLDARPLSDHLPVLVEVASDSG